MTMPPCTLPPQFTSVGAAMNRSTTRSAVPASVYSCPLMAWTMSSRTLIRASAWSRCSISSGVTGSNCGTGMGLPSAPTATKITMHWLRMVAGPPFGSPEDTTVRICIEDRPVYTIVASTSTMSPLLTGSAKWMFPT